MHQKLLARKEKEGAVMKSETFEQLIEISHQALTENHYDAAYYTLAAAYSLARDEQNAQHLHTVERLAREQLKWIDEHAPDYEYSSHLRTLISRASSEQ
jgi:hypothetical protein